MVKQSARVEVNNFIQGFITEASPLNFPPSASLDEENFIADRVGKRYRRLGMDFERGYRLIPLDITEEQYDKYGKSSYYWESAGGQAQNRFIVVQIGNVIRIFDADQEYISELGFLDEIEIEEFDTDVIYSFTSIDGRLVIASGSENVAVVTYNPVSRLFSIEFDRIKVRDLWGVEVVGSEYETDRTFRSSAGPSSHIYNLRNQSWAYPRSNASNVFSDPVNSYRTSLGVFPSNSESVWSGITFSSTKNPIGEIYLPSLSRETLGAEPLAPKGYFIIDLLRRGESRLEQITNLQERYPQLVYQVASLPVDRTFGGPTLVSEYSGRVWFAGFGGDTHQGDARSPDLSSYITYSQLVASPTDIFKCYQDGDPSSRDASDIIDTDGGFIRISGAYNISGMESMGKELVILAENGVWTVSGGGDSQFTGTSYQVKKLSSFGSIAKRAVVVEGDILFYWAEDGINLISRNEFGDLYVTNLTQTTIQKYYDLLPFEDKRNAVGAYNPYDRKVRWLVNTGGYSIELIFDTALQAFYKNRIFNVNGGARIDVVDIGRGEQLVGDFYTVDVIADDKMVLSNGLQVISRLANVVEGIPTNRYVTVLIENDACYLTFSLYRNPLFRDWFSYDNKGVDAKAFLLTGAITGGESSLHKQIPYLLMHFVRTEEGVLNEEPNKQSSCFVRTQWDWANSPNSGKWQNPFQAYRYRRPYFISNPSDSYDNGFETVVTRNKIRGRGRAFSLYMETEEGKDCQILGWVLDVNGNAKV